MKSHLFLSAYVLSPGVFEAAPPLQHPPTSLVTKAPAPGTTNDTVSAVKDTVGHGVGVISAEMDYNDEGFPRWKPPRPAICTRYEAGKIAEQRSQNAKASRISRPRW